MPNGTLVFTRSRPRGAAPAAALRSASSISASTRTRAVVEGRALRRQLELARRAVDQPRAEPRLQPRDQLAHRRGRHAQGAGGGGEAAELDDPDEDLHLAGAVDVDAAPL